VTDYDADTEILLNDWIEIPGPKDWDGNPSLDSEILPVNTLEQIEKAEQILFELGIDRAPVLRGAPPDTIKTSAFVYAREE
jgi:hypothetical protein